MLKAKEFNKFVYEVEKCYQFFCIWRYLHNKNFGKVYKRVGGSGYRNFWGVVSVALQNEFCLGVRRLVDTDKSPYKEDRLSIEYICKNIDPKLAVLFRNDLNKHNRFIKHVKTFSTNYLAHASLNDILSEKDNLIPSGREKFFLTLATYIKKIKESNPELEKCTDINLNFLENISKTGVENLFKDLRRSTEKYEQ
ncbi:MAG: hypothetical protein WC817_05280 [Patescibacteria group bacterium]|jgi:hypothetical protein